MKILISTTSSISALLIRGQGKFLKSKGYEVLYSASDGPQAHKLVEEEGITFIPIPFEREINIKKDIYCLYLACRILMKYKPDIVNAGTPKAGLIYMIAANIVGIKVRIFTLRGLRSSTLTGMKGKIVRFLEKVSCMNATRVIAVSPSLKDEALSLKLTTKDKITVLLKGSSNGVNINRFTPSDKLIEDIKNKKKELNISDTSFVFGFVGRIVKDKGIVELIKAFEKLQKNNDVKLLLAGGYEKDDAIGMQCQEIINNNNDIIEVGRTSEIPLYALMFDVLVLPSYREGFGNVVIEAAAMGTPSIVSNIPGSIDTIEDNYTGLLVNVRDVDSLSNAMEFYMNNREIVKAHGDNAMNRVKKFFTNEMIWNEQDKLYTQLTKGKK